MENIVLCSLFMFNIVMALDRESLMNAPGHLKYLGEGRPIHDIPTIDGFPYTKWFFDNHVTQSKPLLMKNAAKNFPAFKLWNDEYFLSKDEAKNYTVMVEQQKRETRMFAGSLARFSEFVREYREKDIYMVSEVPKFLRSDVILPAPLQCDGIREKALITTIMWYSSGGTRSSIHTDPSNNINCLIRGQKVVLLVPEEYTEKVDIDHPEGSFCGVDVDRADFLKYPGLAEAEYHNVSMEAGDCLYIPYKILHQVRSHDRNIAVNVWWDHFISIQAYLKNCPDNFDTGMTLENAVFHDFESSRLTKRLVRAHFADNSKRAPLNLEQTAEILLRDIIDDLNVIDTQREYMVPMQGIFNLLDEDKNDLIEHEEVINAEPKIWDSVMAEFLKFDRKVSFIEYNYQNRQENEDNGFGDEPHDEL